MTSANNRSIQIFFPEFSGLDRTTLDKNRILKRSQIIYGIRYKFKAVRMPGSARFESLFVARNARYYFDIWRQQPRLEQPQTYIYCDVCRYLFSMKSLKII